MTSLAPGTRPPTPLHRTESPGLRHVVVHRESLIEHHLTFCPLPQESPEALARRVTRWLHDLDAIPVRLQAFGPLRAFPGFQSNLPPLSPNWPAPLTWLEGFPCPPHPQAGLAGLHAMAVSDTAVSPVLAAGNILGASFSDGHLDHVLLGNVIPPDPAAPTATQARHTFERLQAALQTAGLNFTQVARTWLFLDDILAWYPSFNRVRRDFFQQCRVGPPLVPASTGIGARNPAGAPLVAEAWAAQPLHPNARIAEIPSPLQCPAPAYGSSFSRAVEMLTPDLRRILVSGTASIDARGASLGLDDVRAQVQHTLHVLQTLLASRGLDFSDVSRATAYLRHAADAPAVHQALARAGLALAPLVMTQAVVCRDELRFELELDALAPTPGSLNPLP
ncbi:MAG: hypothetical protein KF833_16225 [Verrucomicrobiae bacterium]|nr:hypothetical protein [Verrucomicrobiae bacterium]